MLDIKKLTRSNLKELQDLARKTFVDTFAEYNSPGDMKDYLEKNLSLDSLRNEIENPESIFYGIRKEENLIAYLKLNEGDAQTDQELENALEIERIYVDKDYLGQGIGKQLFEFSVTYAKKHKKQWIWLGVWDRNHHAIEFYKRQGFIKFGEHAFQLGSDAQLDYLYKLAI